MKKEQTLVKKILIKNFYNSLENNYNIKDYSNFKKELDTKLLTLKGLISVYYKQKFLHLIFDEIEEIFSYKYDKKIDLSDNLIFIKNSIEKVDNFIKNYDLLEDLIKKIIDEFDMHYEYTVNTKLNSSCINEINNSDFLNSPCWTSQTKLNFPKIG